MLESKRKKISPKTIFVEYSLDSNNYRFFVLELTNFEILNNILIKPRDVEDIFPFKSRFFVGISSNSCFPI